MEIEKKLKEWEKNNDIKIKKELKDFIVKNYNNKFMSKFVNEELCINHYINLDWDKHVQEFNNFIPIFTDTQGYIWYYFLLEDDNLKIFELDTFNRNHLTFLCDNFDEFLNKKNPRIFQ